MVQKIKDTSKLKLRSARMGDNLSREQEVLREMFDGEPTWGTGKDLPKIEGKLISGGGIINSGDVDRETAAMFGI